MTEEYGAAGPALGKLRRFLGPKPKPRAGERCDFCTEPIEDDHAHLVNLESRTLVCVCRMCYILFSHEGAGAGKYRVVPRRYLRATEVSISDAQWDGLQIPVGMAFFFFNSALGRTVAFYPSPAGATESLLPLEAWDELSRTNSVLSTLAPDVEAFLVRRSRDSSECFVVPIDACYELVGRIRRRWRGFDGGDEARLEIEVFFATVRERSEA